LATISYLLDTDILIDWLQDQHFARRLILSSELRFYCSNVTRKELLTKPGLQDSERRRIVLLLRVVRVLNVDSTIASAASELLGKYSHRSLGTNDALIAATAFVKHLPLLTRNRKHFEFLEEITLADIPPTAAG
jgi:predicted nucleic acid-binding protein